MLFKRLINIQTSFREIIMKTKQTISLTLFVWLLVLAGCVSGKSIAERQADKELMREKIQEPDFTFEATYAHPSGFRSIYLSPYYELKLTPDTVSAYLPYYGRAYRASLDPSEGGIKFTSTDFEYTITEGSKPGNWHIHLQTMDTKRQFTLYLNVWDNGSAHLSVNDPDRQSIAFQGNIKLNNQTK